MFAMMAGAGLSAYLEDRFKWPTLLAFATTVAVIPGDCGVFVIVFDGKGKVIDRHSIGLPRVDQLSHFDNASRLIA